MIMTTLKHEKWIRVQSSACAGTSPRAVAVVRRVKQKIQIDLPEFALVLCPVQNTVDAIAHDRRDRIEDLWTVQGEEQDVRGGERDEDLVAMGRDRKRSHFRARMRAKGGGRVGFKS